MQARSAVVSLGSLFFFFAVTAFAEQTATTTAANTAPPPAVQPNTPATTSGAAVKPVASNPPPGPTPAVAPPDAAAPPKATLKDVTISSAFHYVEPNVGKKDAAAEKPAAKNPQPQEATAKDEYTRTHASLGDSVEITGNDFKSLVRYADENKKSITLYLNGNDTLTTPSIIDPDHNRLVFPLQRTKNNKDLWSSLLNRPYDPRIRKVLASVGVGGSIALPAGSVNGVKSEPSFKLVVAKWDWWAYLWVALLLAVFIWFFSLASKKDLLRDGPQPAGGPKQAYSLGRTQMAWWFFLIIVGFVFIWLIAGDQDTITASLITLMGISSATALGSRLVDTNGGSTPPPPTQTHGSWLKDILSDSTGTVVLHRFQVLIWTLVLGFIFIVTVFTSLSMPVFTDTLLTLMGISSGTYIGFKFSEH